MTLSIKGQPGLHSEFQDSQDHDYITCSSNGYFLGELSPFILIKNSNQLREKNGGLFLEGK